MASLVVHFVLRRTAVPFNTVYLQHCTCTAKGESPPLVLLVCFENYMRATHQMYSSN